jgi:hypothetical protein
VVDDAGRIFIIGDEVRDCDEQNADRPIKIDQGLQLGVAQESVRPAQITKDGRYSGASCEQRSGVHDYLRVVIYVDHAGIGVDLLGDLVNVAACGQTGANVDELPDSRLGGQVLNRSAEERPIAMGGFDGLGYGGLDLFCGSAIGLVVVLATQEVIVDTRWCRHGYIEVGG